jgi:hypothetical protein
LPTASTWPWCPTPGHRVFRTPGSSSWTRAAGRDPGRADSGCLRPTCCCGRQWISHDSADRVRISTTKSKDRNAWFEEAARINHTFTFFEPRTESLPVLTRADCILVYDQLLWLVS